MNADLWSYRSIADKAYHGGTGSALGAKKAHRSKAKRHHPRDLEEYEGLSRRALDLEELFGREYDNILAERGLLGDVVGLSRRDLDVEELFGREYDDYLVERDYFNNLD